MDPYPGNNATASNSSSGGSGTDSTPKKTEINMDNNKTFILKNETSVEVESKDDDFIYIKITKGERIVEITM